MILRFEIFASEWDSWETLCGRAADFATSIGPDYLVGISHSESPSRKGVVTVWYWYDATEDRSMS